MKTKEEAMSGRFSRQVACTLNELYGCNGIDGFDDLLEEKLGHPIADATWSIAGIDIPKGQVLIQVEGEVFGDEWPEAANCADANDTGTPNPYQGKGDSIESTTNKATKDVSINLDTFIPSETGDRK